MNCLQSYSYYKAQSESVSGNLTPDCLCPSPPAYGQGANFLRSRGGGRDAQTIIGTSFSPRNHAGSHLFTFTYGWSLCLEFLSLSPSV